MTRGKSFGIASKLLAVCLGFSLPIVVMFVLMTRAKLTEIDFAAKEIVGDEYQQPLEEVLQHASRHRRLWARLRRGDASVAATLKLEATAVEVALGHVAAVDRIHGVELLFTPEGLGLRKRSEFTARGLERKWKSLVAALPTATLADGDAAHAAVIGHVRTMITHAGDESNLILDPDLDSYYLMDVTLLALPQMEERVQQTAVSVDELVAAGHLTPSDRLHLGVMAAFLEEADWERVASSAGTALNEDQNFHGALGSLRPAIAPGLREAGRVTRRVVNALAALSADESIDEFDIAAFRSDIDELDGVLYTLHVRAFEQENALLDARIVDFRRSLHWGFVLAAASLVVASLLAFLLAANIVRRVRRLSSVTEALARGEMRARVGHAGSDEIGELSRSFDAMADRIGGLTAEVRQRADELARVNSDLEHMVEDRTRELTRRNGEFRLILDNAHDGMVTVDLDGVMSGERSAILDRWFGTPEPGSTLPTYLGRNDADLAATMRLALEQIREDVLPLELTLEQLPHETKAGGKQFRMSYQPIRAGETVTRLLVILSDVTSELEGRKATALQQEVLRIFHACQRDRAGFLDFFVDAREIVAKVCENVEKSPGELRRLIHTLKGNCALFGVLSVSELCHDLETSIAENGGIASPSDIARLELVWGELSTRVAQLLGEDPANRLEVADEEYAAIVDAIARGAPRRDILTAIARWKLEPTERRLARFSERAKSAARRIGKDIEVTTHSNDVRLCGETWVPIWSALAHVIRNAVDHGIEPSEERIRRGKPPVGQLTLTTAFDANRVWIEIADDGRGIAWDVVAARAKAAGLPDATRSDLVSAVLTDGITTRDVITDISGRGLGMAAVREACATIGGVVEIDSEPFKGTTIRCSFPKQLMGGRVMTSVVERPITESLAPGAGVPAEAATA